MLSLRLPARATLLRHPTRFASLATGALLLGGCSVGNYPSLQHCAANPCARAAPAAGQPLPQGSAPILAASPLNALAKARAAYLRFHSQQAQAETAIAAASMAAPDSEEMARANIAMASLEAARGETAQSLADLERIYSDDRIAHALDDAGTGPARPSGLAIARAHDEVLGIIAEEDKVLTELASHLQHEGR